MKNAWLVVVAACLFVGGCGGGGGGGSSATTPPVTPPVSLPVAAPPTFSLASGTYMGTVTVSLADTTAGATIYYTTNGAAPSTASTSYQGAVAVAASTTIKAIAAAPGATDSPVATASYTIQPLAPTVTAAPVFAPTPGTYTGTQSVTLTDTNPAAAIYYTTDGTNPSSASTHYTGPVRVAATTSILATAMAPGDATSALVEGIYTIRTTTAVPSIAAAAGNGAQNGAQIVTLADATPGATIYYTTDGSVPTSNSTPYLAPFLVAANLTVQAYATSSGLPDSPAASRSFAPNIASGTLVWSDEFTNTSGANVQPNPQIWTYDVGNSGFGNSELENYCAWGSNLSPCDPTAPSSFVGTDGYLHIVAAQPTPGVYTSARLKTQGLFSFQYGRYEVRVSVPEAQGFWPAAWLLGNTYPTLNWPACGEMDVQERVNAARSPDFNVGSIHGPGFIGSNLGQYFYFTGGQTAATFHTYGMIWKPGSVAYYIDDPANPYVTFTPAVVSAALPNTTWPFDAGPSFMLLNLAVGGQWPGAPDTSTPFPSSSLIDYVRIYAN